MSHRAAEASEVAAGPSARWHSARATHAGMAEVRMSGRSHLVARLLASKDVETVDGVEHHVAVDGVVFRVAALHGRDGA